MLSKPTVSIICTLTRSPHLSLHSVGSACKFVSVNCLSSIALHPYYKLAYIELAWGSAKEQDAKYKARNFEAKNW
jgi:hypothetical protein